jgi:hypothetical protein
MEFRENGEYVYHQIAPADGYLELKGTFEIKNDSNDLFVSYAKNDNKFVIHYRIIKLTPDVLKIRLIEN